MKKLLIIAGLAAAGAGIIATLIYKNSACEDYGKHYAGSHKKNDDKKAMEEFDRAIFKSALD